MNTLNQLVTENQEQIDTIEDFIEQSKNDVKESEETISTASSYSTYVTGTIGTIGTIIGLFVISIYL
jgi:t-SNARE complex subunit (syntaxin)